MKSIFNISLFSFFFFCNFQFAKTQDVTLLIEDVVACHGEEVCFDLIFNDFTDVNGLDLTIYFDPSKMDFISYTASGALEGLLNNTTVADSLGWIAFSWFEPNTDLISLPNGTVMSTLCFEIIGDPGMATEFNIVEAIANHGDGNESEMIFVPNIIDITTCNEFIVFEDHCSPSSSVSTDGSISITACCNYGPYTYTSVSLGNGTLTESVPLTFDNLGPGIHTINVTGTNGETETIVITLDANDPLTVEHHKKDPRCFDKANGQFYVDTIYGGTPPYKIAWSTFEFHSNLSDDFGDVRIIGLSNNTTYYATITDAHGCTNIISESLEVEVLEVTATLIDSASCEDSEDGQVLLTGSGGTPFPNGYNYNGDLSYTGFDFLDTEVAAGWYTFYINGDPKSCKSELDSIWIPFKKTIHFDEIVMDDIKCFGGVTDISVDMKNFYKFKAPSIMYDSDNNPVPNGATVGDFTLVHTDVPAGTYTIRVSEHMTGCKADTTFTILEPDSLYITPEITHPNCLGDNGIIEIFPNGGTPDYTYQWDDLSIEKKRENLGGGTYIITLVDNNGCRDSLPIIINDSEPLTGMINVLTPVTCEDNTSGSLEAIVTSTGVNNTYEWFTSAGSFSTDKIITSLSANTYYLEITDIDFGCKYNDTITLNPPLDLTLDISTVDPTCPNSFDGSITLTITSGNPPFKYDWEGYPENEDNNVLSNIKSGIYKVTITDDNNCESVNSYELQSPNPIIIDISGLTGVTCNGLQNGSVLATATGGTTMSGLYDYTWSSSPLDGGTNIATNLANNLAPNNQWVIASDSDCPSDTLFFDIPEPTVISLLDSTLVMPSCSGDCDGNITITPTGGTGTLSDYQYNWLGGSNTNSINNICAGNQQVTITDINGCTVEKTISLTEPEPLIASIDLGSIREISCNNGGTIVVQHTGGNVGNIQYNWTDNVSTIDLADDLVEGTYTITVTDSKGCFDTTSYTLIPPIPISFTVNTPDPIPCNGGETCISVSNILGGVGNIVFSIDNSPNHHIDSCVIVVAGEYTVTVIDNDGCSNEQQIIINQPNKTNLSITPDDLVFDLGADPETLDLTVSNNDAPIESIIWTPEDQLDCLTLDCMQIEINPTDNITYYVSAIDENGCESNTSVDVIVDAKRNVYFPNIFAPNGGEFGNFSFSLGTGVVKLDFLHIYDRWGNEVYSIENIVPGEEQLVNWDGRYKGQLLNPGVFVYSSSVTFLDGRTIPYKGSVTLIR